MHITLYVGDAPSEDLKFHFRDPNVWECVRSQIENITNTGHGLLRLPREGGGESCFVINSSSKLMWIDRG